MKKTLLSLIVWAAVHFVNAQSNSIILDVNNVSAIIRNDGILFKGSSGAAGYEIPKGSSKYTIFASGLWCAALDDTGTLHLSGTRFGQMGKDYFPGPISTSYAYNDSAYTANYASSIWSINASEIQFHLSNFSQAGYIMPQSIQSWPANGVSGLGVSLNLAPFVDLNNNGIYEPNIGEYPDIRGDKATYVIMNDVKLPHTETGGLPLGIEVHVMAYQFSTNDYLNNTTFINYRIYNRGVNDYPHFKLAQFTDFDLGNPIDDYIACDSLNDLMYTYNGDNNDEGSLSSYGQDPPACGLVSLNQSMEFFAYFTNGASYPYTDPITAPQYYNLMKGSWTDGSPWYYGGTGAIGTIPTNYLFSGNPNDPNGWSEITVGNPPGDRRGVMTIEEVNLPAGGSACYDFAVLFARGAGNDNLQNVNALIALAATAKSDFEAMNFNCNQVTLGLDKLEEMEIGLFPNPTAGVFTLSFGHEMITGEVFVSDLNGRIILLEEITTANNKTIQLDANQGVYYVSVKTNKGTINKKLILTK